MQEPKISQVYGEFRIERGDIIIVRESLQQDNAVLICLGISAFELDIDRAKKLVMALTSFIEHKRDI